MQDLSAQLASNNSHRIQHAYTPSEIKFYLLLLELNSLHGYIGLEALCRAFCGLDPAQGLTNGSSGKGKNCGCVFLIWQSAVASTCRAELEHHHHHAAESSATSLRRAHKKPQDCLRRVSEDGTELAVHSEGATSPEDPGEIEEKRTWT